MAGPSKTNLTEQQWYDGIVSGNRTVLAQAITAAESTLASDRKLIEALIRKLLPKTGNSIRIGITGVPGVGKSTFIEVFGEFLSQKKKKIAVLTVDPTSEKSKGSILGDKTRMEKLSKNPQVFIRPSPSRLATGGVSFHTRECILLCEAAGFDVILIETVGVGQSETQVRNMVDFFLLLMLAGAGDELQGIKKGIIEMADSLVITKADGTNEKAATQALADARTTLHMQSAAPSGWKPKALSISSLENKGIAEVWQMIVDYQKQLLSNGYFESHRRDQKAKWLEECLEGYVREFMNESSFLKKKEKLLKEVMNDELLPTDAAQKLWHTIMGKK